MLEWSLYDVACESESVERNEARGGKTVRSAVLWNMARGFDLAKSDGWYM
jgi:hypothetical protein